MFRLSQVAEVNRGRRTLITKHVVAMPAETSPVDFGRRVQDEAQRMTHRLLKNLKTWGPKTLMDAIAEAEEKKIADRERRETVRREASYFRDHEGHMDYRTARREGVPIGSGAMESQCSQNQNRFKRRGQSWSRGGFASFLEAYVWYANNEIKYLYRPAA